MFYKIFAESEMISAIQLHANIRGFDLPNDSANYLLRRVERNVGSLIEIIKVLDYESLSKQRKITIPFIKNILQFNSSG